MEGNICGGDNGDGNPYYNYFRSGVFQTVVMRKEFSIILRFEHSL